MEPKCSLFGEWVNLSLHLQWEEFDVYQAATQSMCCGSWRLQPGLECSSVAGGLRTLETLHARHQTAEKSTDAFVSLIMSGRLSQPDRRQRLPGRAKLMGASGGERVLGDPRYKQIVYFPLRKRRADLHLWSTAAVLYTVPAHQ